MPAQSFVKGTFTLFTAGVVVKALGFLYQMITVRLIGSEGIGIFNMVYPLYSMALVLTTAGIPTAIVRMIPEHRNKGKGQDGHTLLRVGATLLIVSSSIIAFALIIFGPWLLRFLHNDPRVIPPFLFLVPTLLLVSVSSAIRSYFQGHQDMRSTANAQLIEQVIRLVSGITLAYIMVPYGLVWAITSLALAILFSELSGFFYLWHYFIKHTKQRSLLQAPHPKLTRSMYRFGLPLTFTKVLLTASGALEALLIPARLQQAGFSMSQAASLYGELTGVAFPILNIPALITLSMSTALIPTIAEAQGCKNYKLLKQRSLQAIGFTLFVGIPAALVLFFWGDKVIYLIFKVSNAGLMIRYLSFAGIFLWLNQISSGILQGLGLVVHGTISTLVSCLLRLVFLYLFTTNPQNIIQGIVFKLWYFFYD